ncbi:MAG: hypothetical protein Q9170_005754 [Blastenia crenularia]
MSSTTPVQPPGLFPPPPGVTANFTNPPIRTDGIKPLVSIFLPLSFLFLVLRLYTKARIIKLVGLEDLFATLGWLCCAVYTIPQWAGFNYGGGTHIWNQMLPDYYIYTSVIHSSPLRKRTAWLTNEKLASAEILCNVPSVSLPKIAILLFYLRLNPAKSFRYSTFAVLGLTVTYLVSFEIAQIFQCNPVRKLWRPLIPGKCLNFYPVYVAIPIINVIIDFMVLLLPIPMLVKLHANRRTKIVLGVIFAFSGCTVIISAVRVWAVQKILKNNDLSWNAGPSNAITVVEVNMTTICACIMVLRPFCRRHLPFLLGSGKSKPTDDNNDAMLAFDGPLGPKSKSDYHTKVSGGGSRGSKKPGKRSLWSNLGGGTLRDDDEDMESLSKELRVIAPHVGTNGASRGNNNRRDKARWQDQDNTQSSESIEAQRTGGRDSYPLSREGDLENGIVKTVSLDVR